MRQRTLLHSALTFLGLASLLLLTLGTAPATDGARKLAGSYAWDQGGVDGDLEAVFTPTGENTWGVSFHFEFRGSPHTYTGTATGSLSDGPLAGSVTNENEKRTWTFEGTFANGSFKGKHVETTDGRSNTGTLTLAAN